MKTIRVILTAEEVTHALVSFAYDKTGRTEEVQTGAVSVLLALAPHPEGGAQIQQARVEMDLPE